MPTYYLDGNSLTPEDLVNLGSGDISIDLTPEAWQKVQECRDAVDQLVANKQPVYGINTGFGNFASVSISDAKLSQLQVNLITSHAAGTGAPLSLARTRMLLALRINVLAKGYSGIRKETVQTMVKAFNMGCLSYVPEKGTVGASGDLAPLSHLALGLIGRGKMWDTSTQSYETSQLVLEKYNISPISLGPKEGLAMINGTQFISSLGAEAVVRAKNLVKCADIIGALSLEVMKGTPKAFDEKIHLARPHKGQIASAERLRKLLHTPESPSQIYESHVNCDRVQDAYTLRCMPQVHGIVADTVSFTDSILTTELNSATDNPMIFTQPNASSISGGNFHGEYPAKAMDYLAIGVHELSSISERRIERLVNAQLSGGLPAFLVQEGGLNSGFMIAHCTAAALVSENKVLCHPASIDSIPTSAAKEDHVSMGGFSSRKCLSVIENVEKVLGIELICACQALDFHRPLKTTKALERVYELVRGRVEHWQVDGEMYPLIEAGWGFVKSGEVVSAAGI